MKNGFLSALFLFSLFSVSSLSAVEIIVPPFRINYIVYYHILHKMQGISMNEFKNVKVISESGSELVFEYAGKQYTATVFGDQGVIYVKMPEGMRDRYLSQQRFPAIVLTDFDKR